LSGNPPDLITALTKSIEMEKRLADLHVESALHFKDDSIQKMFQALQQADQEHVKSLQHLLSIVSLPHAEMRA
jgi:rubrerythrin